MEVFDPDFDEDLIAMAVYANSSGIKLNAGGLSFQRSVLIQFLEGYVSSGAAIPPAMASELARGLKVVESGHLDPLFMPVDYGKRGTRGRELLEIRCIRIAVRYRLGADCGNIRDSTPMKTIREAFGGETDISETTIRSWMSEFRDKLQPLPQLDPDAGLQILHAAGHAYREKYTRRARANRNTDI